MAKLIDFPKPMRLPIDLPRQEGWLYEFPAPRADMSAVIPEHMLSSAAYLFHADPDGDIA